MARLAMVDNPVTQTAEVGKKQRVDERQANAVNGRNRKHEHNGSNGDDGEKTEQNDEERR
ncbi:MAG: hypothetical protein MZU97_16750 [Bacillus subtilis]|nr:hypothetical protein [Bacillus subtilis]